MLRAAIADIPAGNAVRPWPCGFNHLDEEYGNEMVFAPGEHGCDRSGERVRP